MAEAKPKHADSLRTPKPKKKLGLSVPPALRLPHEDLIIAPVAAGNNKLQALNEKKELSMPSQTSQTTIPSLTSQTRHSSLADREIKISQEVPISPQKDFTKVANSIGRQAVPAGLFSGKSKQLYDCLYSMTRGAIVPARSVRISRPKLMKKAGIGSRVTFDANIERLIEVGLISVRHIIGEHDGNEYSVFLPEEMSLSMPSLTSQTSLTSPAQKLVRLVSLETSQTRHTLSPAIATTSVEAKTSFKTIDKNDDDEAFAALNENLRRAVREVTGREPQSADESRWGELGELLATEFKIAAARTQVSSAPAFFTEHLRRRLWKTDKKLAASEKPQIELQRKINLSAEQISKCPDCGGTGFYYPKGFENGVARCKHHNANTPSVEPKRLAENEFIEQTNVIADLLEHGYTITQAEEQLSASLDPRDWQKIVEELKIRGKLSVD